MSKLFPVIILLLIVSCGQKPGDQGYHMPPKMMQQVLMDVNLAEAFSVVVRDSVHKPGVKNIDSLAVYYASVFNHYKISAEQFNESLEWYKAHSEKLDSIYTVLLANVTTQQNKLSPLPVAPTTAIPATSFPPHFVKPGERP